MLTEIGLQPEGAMFESFRTHEVTRFQVHAIVPFHDTVWRGEITGARLKEVLAKPSGFAGVMHATIAMAVRTIPTRVGITRQPE